MVTDELGIGAQEGLRRLLLVEVGDRVVSDLGVQPEKITRAAVEAPLAQRYASSTEANRMAAGTNAYLQDQPVLQKGLRLR